MLDNVRTLCYNDVITEMKGKEMTTEEAKQIVKQYNEYDEKFRAAKKSKYTDPRPWKAKRDALEAQLTEAHSVIRENKSA